MCLFTHFSSSAPKTWSCGRYRPFSSNRILDENQNILNVFLERACRPWGPNFDHWMRAPENGQESKLFCIFPPKIRSELFHIAHFSIPQMGPQKALRSTPKSIPKRPVHHKPTPNWFLKKKNFGKNFHFFLCYWFSKSVWACLSDISKTAKKGL